jgi:ubiquinone/menaquinone biosynthesis C-methylase UbiE
MVKEDKPQGLVDIVSGMGTLANDILRSVNYDLHIIVIDQSLSICL